MTGPVGVRLVCGCGATFDAVGSYEGIGSVTCSFCGAFLTEIGGWDAEGASDNDLVIFDPEVRVISRPWAP